MATLDFPENDEMLSRGAFRHELAQRLLVGIFEGKMPAGARLVVMSLAKRFGLSATPVREALFELETSGLVQFTHNRGAVVKPFGPAQLREIFQVRGILETAATSLACDRIDQLQLKSLRKTLDTIDKPNRHKKSLDAEMAADRQLHELIAASCGSVRLAEEIRRYDMLVQGLREVVGNDRRAISEAVAEHRAIIDAMISGKADVAAAAMASHVNRAAHSAERALFGHKSAS